MNMENIPKSQLDKEQLLQSLQPLTTVPLDQLSDEQVNILLDRLTALKQQKQAARQTENGSASTEAAHKETSPADQAAVTDAPTQVLTPPSPTHITPSDAPVPRPTEHSVNDAVLKKAAEAASALAHAEQGTAAEEPASDDTVIFPDPACFDHLGEEPKNGVDFDPSMSTYSGSDDPTDDNERDFPAPSPIPKVSEYDTRPLSSDDMDTETISIYRDLVRRRRKQRGLLISLVTVFAVLLLLICGIIAFVTLYEPTVDDDPPPFWSGETQADSTIDATGNDSSDTTPEIPHSAPIITDSYDRRDGVYNFLVLGVDRAANLSDVIMVVSYDTEQQKVHILSLPRDTYINVGSSYHKLNAYFSASYNRSASRGAERYRDAIEAMASFIENGLCIRLDRYICMDTAGFREIIDALGGVDMEVPFDMDYEDPEQDLFIHLKAGYQHLDGEKAEQFVRFRSGYLEGDIGRISAQRLFLTALVNQIKTKLDITTAVNIAKTALQYVTTDLTAAEIGFFAKSAFSVDLSAITFTTLPGGGVINPDTGASYYVMYAENVRKIVNEQFNVYDREITREVFLNNSKKFTNDAPYIAEVFLSEIRDSGTVSADDIQSGAPEIPHR